MQVAPSPVSPRGSRAIHDSHPELSRQVVKRKLDQKYWHGCHRPVHILVATDPESRACACSTPRRRAGRLPCVLPPPAPPLPGSMRRKSSRVTWCPCERGCAGPLWTGKPLQIAVDGLPGTTEATQHPGTGSTALLAATTIRSAPSSSVIDLHKRG
jgi:hypothetical protein